MMKGYDTWIQFENDLCDRCNKSKYGKLKILNGTLTFIVSCDCDTCVFRDEWKAETNLIVVLDPDGVNTTLRMIAEHMGDK